MADNLLYTQPASGASIATDDVGGVQYQKVKIDLGGDGLSVPVVGTLPVSDAALEIAQGASSTGVTGPLVQGVVTDSAQPVITGNVQPLSLTSEGRLRVVAAESFAFASWGDVENYEAVPSDYGVSAWG